MPLSRRACAMGAGAVVLVCALSASAVHAGTDWPTHPIRILVGFGAGGGTDVATRIIADDSIPEEINRFREAIVHAKERSHVSSSPPRPPRATGRER